MTDTQTTSTPTPSKLEKLNEGGNFYRKQIAVKLNVSEHIVKKCILYSNIAVAEHSHIRGGHALKNGPLEFYKLDEVQAALKKYYPSLAK